MRGSGFSRTILMGLIVMVMALSLSGCFYIIFGGAAAAGGYAVSRDTIQGEIDREFSEVWDAASEIISIKGIIESQSHELGEIVAIINGARVTTTVIQLTPATIRLKVKARKSIFPSIHTAQEVFVKIMNRLTE